MLLLNQKGFHINFLFILNLFILNNNFFGKTNLCEIHIIIHHVMTP